MDKHEIAAQMKRETEKSLFNTSRRWVKKDAVKMQLDSRDAKLIIFDGYLNTLRFESYSNEAWTPDEIREWLKAFFDGATVRLKVAGPRNPQEFISAKQYLSGRCQKTGYGLQLWRRKDSGKHCAIYARVSTSDQNIEMQLDALKEYADRKGYQLYDVYADEGISGTRKERPELNRLMKDARKLRFQVVLVWKFDRFARSTEHLVSALGEFQELGIDFYSFTEGIDTGTSYGKMIYTFLAAIAEFERDLISERVRAGMDRAKKKGKKIGRPRAKLPIQLLLSLKAEGKTYQEITHLVNKHHGLEVSESTVSRAIKKGLESTTKGDPGMLINTDFQDV